MNEQDYIDYFENLATQHAQLQHDPDPAGDHQAFYYVHSDNLTEVELAVRNALSLPALLLDQYYDESDTDSDNNRLRIQGGLSVLCSVEAGDPMSFRAARQQARAIAQSVLKRLRADCRYNGALYARNVLVSPSAAGEPVPLIGGNTAGWGYSFTLLVPDRQAVDDADWLDR